MFSRVIPCTFLVLPLLAVATAIPSTTPASCSTGPVQCCNSVESASNPIVGLLAGLLGVVLGPIVGQVGLTCSPILLGGAACTAQTVCCNGNNFSGLLVVGCTPININL